jgi:hypothetical protein
MLLAPVSFTVSSFLEYVIGGVGFKGLWRAQIETPYLAAVLYFLFVSLS